MPKIKCNAEIVADMLFGDHYAEVKITGCRYNVATQIIEFDIDGPGIPDTPEVRAIFTAPTKRAVRFETVVPL